MQLMIIHEDNIDGHSYPQWVLTISTELPTPPLLLSENLQLLLLKIHIIMNQRSWDLGNFNHRLKFSYICTDDATLNVCTSRNQIWLWEFTFSTCSFISICCSPTLRSPPCCGSQYISTEFGKCLQSTACQLGANFNMIILIRCSWNRFFKILLFVANLFLFFTLLNV